MLVDRTSHAPVLGLFSGFVHDWIPLIDEYYYCTCHHFLPPLPWLTHPSVRHRSLSIGKFLASCTALDLLWLYIVYHNSITSVGGVAVSDAAIRHLSAHFTLLSECSDMLPTPHQIWLTPPCDAIRLRPGGCFKPRSASGKLHLFLLQLNPYPIMSNPLTPHLPDLRRIVTTHNEQGVAVVQSDLRLSAQVILAPLIKHHTNTRLRTWKPSKGRGLLRYGSRLTQYQPTIPTNCTF